MIKPLLFALPDNESFTADLAATLGSDLGTLDHRSFPDGETYLRLGDSPAGRNVVLVCTLANPNAKFLPLLLAAATARDQGAAKVGLVAPYLAYMRQDRRFHEGEAVTSRHVAGLLSSAFDWLVTVDPHLHRYKSLSEIYTIPSEASHAASLISDWIKANVPTPLLIGPDEESEQWVAAVAADIGAPFTVLKKIRHGDRDVEIRVKHLERLPGRTPVLVDDIISSGRTMLEAVHHIREHTSAPVICVAVHGIFADHSDIALLGAGARVVTTNTISHSSNEIDITGLLAPAIKALA